jgi:hypothetical protein
MTEDIALPECVVKTTKSQFRLRCHAVSWAKQYGGRTRMYRRCGMECPGLLMLSVTGPDTAVKSIRATLYEPDIDAEFLLEQDDALQQLVKARLLFDGKLVVYSTATAKLAPGVIHMVALAKIPGLMPNMSDDHLWGELTGPQYTTPLLRSWIPWLKQAMATDERIVVGDGLASSVGVLKIEPDELDALVSLGIKDGHLNMVA